MKAIFILLITLFSVGATGNEADNYKLGAGDDISILVYGEPDLSIDVRIGSSGSISYPFLGDLTVSGLTVKQFEEKIVAGLKGPYLIDPSVTVGMIEYRPFYVNGEVKRPGSYPFQPGLTVDRAISIAGGYTDRASRNKIFVERVQPNDGKTSRLSVKLQDNIVPGDVVTVEQSFF